MNPVSSVSSSPSNQQTLALLQSQMVRYAQSANGHNSQASADYKALQTAITSGNVSQAQAALTRLQRDSKTTNSGANAPTSTPSTTQPPVDTDGDHDGSTAVHRSTGGSLNATA
jgi:hypothetical protein